MSEAAVVARTLTRASALQKDREQLRQQVRDLSQELRDLKGKQKSMALNMQAAASEGGGSGSAARIRLQRQQPASPAVGRGGAISPVSSDVALEERCRLQAVEERHLRSEVEMLSRKVGRVAACNSTVKAELSRGR